MPKAHLGPITFLEFLPNELVLMSGSSTDNSIYQYQYSEQEATKFVKIR